MKFAGIEARFTEVVGGYMANGYTLNARTMGGTQGEIAKVDLCKGNDLIRVYIARGCDSDLFCDIVELVVGRCKACNKKDRIEFIVWNSKLEVLLKETYWDVSYKAGSDWYVSKEEAFAGRKLHYARSNARRVRNCYVFGDKAREIVLPKLRTIKGFKRAKVDTIQRVYRETLCGENHWCFETVDGKTYAV